MRVVFRADASCLIGTGHVMRCLTLADALTKQGTLCEFICREQTGNLIDIITGKGYSVQILPRTEETGNQEGSTDHGHFLGCSQLEDARECLSFLKKAPTDWLIVDHYGLDSLWENELSAHYKKIMVIDDLADRPHQCHLLLDQTFSRPAQDYAPWVAPNCTLLCGSQYSLLRPEFSNMRPTSLKRRKNTPRLQKLLISMGGVDKDNSTALVLNSLKDSYLPDDTIITVIMGAHAPWLENVKELASQMPWPTTVRANVTNMAELMSESDLAIGAAGATAWERCCMGLPCLMLILADNQRFIAEKLDDTGAAKVLPFNDNHFDTPLTPSMFSADFLGEMSRKAAVITDGLGAQHVTKFLTQHRVTS